MIPGIILVPAIVYDLVFSNQAHREAEASLHSVPAILEVLLLGTVSFCLLESPRVRFVSGIEPLTDDLYLFFGQICRGFALTGLLSLSWSQLLDGGSPTMARSSFRRNCIVSLGLLLLSSRVGVLD